MFEQCGSYPFVDVELARRLESLEAFCSVDGIDTRKRIDSDSTSAHARVGGAYLLFDGVGSPLTQTFGLGLFEAVTPGDLDEIEAFFRSRGAGVFHEVCPLAQSGTMELLCARGYRAFEFTSVMYRAVGREVRIEGARNPAIGVRRARADETDLWAATATEGWSDHAEISAVMRGIVEMNAHRERSVSFFAELEGKAIGVGELFVDGKTALLAGACTIPRARRQGAQRALLEARLRHAAEAGCEMVMMCALVGSDSQRNAERCGFRIAYTRIKWALHEGSA